MIGNLKDLKTTEKETWIDIINKQYNYKKNLEHLKERYLNKIKWLEDKMNQVNRDNYFGIIEGLKIAIHDIEDMLNRLDV